MWAVTESKNLSCMIQDGQHNCLTCDQVRGLHAHDENGFITTTHRGHEDLCDTRDRGGSFCTDDVALPLPSREGHRVCGKGDRRSPLRTRVVDRLRLAGCGGRPGSRGEGPRDVCRS